VLNIINEIEDCRNDWLLHTYRMKTDRIAKQKLEYEPVGA